MLVRLRGTGVRFDVPEILSFECSLINLRASFISDIEYFLWYPEYIHLKITPSSEQLHSVFNCNMPRLRLNILHKYDFIVYARLLLTLWGSSFGYDEVVVIIWQATFTFNDSHHKLIIWTLVFYFSKFQSHFILFLLISFKTFKVDFKFNVVLFHKHKFHLF